MFDRLPLPSQFDRVIITGGIVVGLIGVPFGIVMVTLVVLGIITAPEMVFFVAALVILLGAVGCVLLPNIVHAALSLTATLIGVAAVYLLLLSEFLALVQVLVYGGGVVLLLLFGLMMTNGLVDTLMRIMPTIPSQELGNALQQGLDKHLGDAAKEELVRQ